jgi:hypothetical protein
MEFGKPHAYRGLMYTWELANDAENLILQALQSASLVPRCITSMRTKQKTSFPMLLCLCLLSGQGGENGRTAAAKST